jgi:hypothetical protein
MVQMTTRYSQGWLTQLQLLNADRAFRALIGLNVVLGDLDLRKCTQGGITRGWRTDSLRLSTVRMLCGEQLLDSLWI